MKLKWLPALLVTGALSATGTAADSYPKNFDIDVLHYVFELTLSDASDRIDGVATVQVRFEADAVRAFELDLVGRAPGTSTGMTVASVVEIIEAGDAGWPGTKPGAGVGDAGRLGTTNVATDSSTSTPLSFSHDRDRLRIELASAASPRQIRRFRIEYSGVPERGLIIGDNKHGDRTFFSDNWPNWARNWLPTIDHPYEKATSEMIVTAADHYQVISNGLLVEETDLEGEVLEAAQAAAGMPGVGFRRTHWKQSVPIAPWLYVLGVARFAVDYYDELDGVSLQTWVYAQDRDAGFYDFAVPTRHVMEFYRNTIGPYAYEKLANVQSNSVGGGMEAATAIFYGDDSVTGERSVRWRNVIIHEIAHQWWGNAVTEADWDDVWLSEGFATYFTLLYREFAYGRDDMLAGLANDKRRIIEFYADRPHYTVVHDNLMDISRGSVTTGMMYAKGSWTLHMLRGLVGEDRFWAGIREYYRLYMNGNATTDDFREVMENTFEPAIDLTWFFDQWLRQGGFPHLRGGWEWDATAGEVVITLEQIDDDGYMFEMPIRVEITVPPSSAGAARGGRGGRRGGGPSTVAGSVMMQPGTSTTRIAVEREPTGVVLDPGGWVLMEADFVRR